MEVGPPGAQFGHSDSNDVRYAARFDGRELDSTDNWVRFGKRDFSTETGKTQRTSPSVFFKTLRSEHQSPLCLQGSAKCAQNSAERNLRPGESRRKIVGNELDGKKLSVTRTGSKARLPEQPQNRRTRPAE